MIAEGRALSRCAADNTESGAHITGSTTTSAPPYAFATRVPGIDPRRSAGQVLVVQDAVNDRPLACGPAVMNTRPGLEARVDGQASGRQFGECSRGLIPSRHSDCRRLGRGVAACVSSSIRDGTKETGPLLRLPLSSEVEGVLIHLHDIVFVVFPSSPPGGVVWLIRGHRHQVPTSTARPCHRRRSPGS